jgi:predicted metal-dependent phosphoesterase TrpH
MQSQAIEVWCTFAASYLSHMPRRDPFTALCRQFAEMKSRRLADLHAHTTTSDGDWTPSQLVAQARNAKLAAIAITDHDTTAGVAEALRTAAAMTGIDVVPGVELSVSFRGREIHVLGLFVDPDDAALTEECRRMGVARRERFDAYLVQLAAAGWPIPVSLVERVRSTAASLGRRHVASLLIESGHASSQHAAFTKHLAAVVERIPPKRLAALPDAIRLIRDAGGISILAHPPGEFDRPVYEELAALGLDGVESRHPSASNTQVDYLRDTARSLGMTVSAGSDCHGPWAVGRSFGSYGLYPDEFDALKARAAHADQFDARTPSATAD